MSSEDSGQADQGRPARDATAPAEPTAPTEPAAPAAANASTEEPFPEGRLPGVRRLTDARTMRALTHPVRIALLGELMHGGAMTATEVGERIGETPTTCSFHLRQLARYGFVEEAGGGHGRARPWRLTYTGLYSDPDGSPESKIAEEAATSLFRERQYARYQTWRRTQASYPPQWQEAAYDGVYQFYLTAEELERLNGELREVLMRWFVFEGRIGDPSRRPPGSVPVQTMLFSHPTAPPASITPQGPSAPDPSDSPIPQDD